MGGLTMWKLPTEITCKLCGRVDWAPKRSPFPWVVCWQYASPIQQIVYAWWEQDICWHVLIFAFTLKRQCHLSTSDFIHWTTSAGPISGIRVYANVCLALFLETTHKTYAQWQVSLKGLKHEIFEIWAKFNRFFQQNSANFRVSLPGN